MSRWIRKGDQVKVIAGNDKGKHGEVLSRSGDRVVIQGINLRKKHIRRSEQAPQGGLIEREASMHVSNVAICDAQGNKLSLAFKQEQDGKRTLVSKQGNSETVYRVMRK